MPRDTTSRFAASACPHDCPSTCALEVELLPDGKTGRYRGAPDHPYTRGVLCTKVARYADRAHAPNRLMQPLRRTGPKGSGQFSPISWDEAMDDIGNRFGGIIASHGAEALWPYYYAGTMGWIQRDSIQALRRRFGMSEQKRTFCTTIVGAGWTAGMGSEKGRDPLAMLKSDLIIVWGANSVATNIHAFSLAQEARKQRGAKIIVIDPYRSPTAALADLHLPLIPGSDAALACAVMHIAFRDGLADRAYLAAHTDFPAGLEAHLAARSPAWAAALTGLSTEQIEAFAALYLATPNAYLLTGYGLSRGRNGASTVHAVSCLPAVSGAWKHPGGGAFWAYGAPVYGFINRTPVQGVPVPVRELDMSRMGAALTGHLTGDRSELQDGPPVMGLLIQNTNPAVVAPNSGLVRQGLLREDLFTVVHEQFMTDTALLADIVLPATQFIEHDDLYVAGGHATLQLGPKLIAAPGLCRSNLEVNNEIARRLGATEPRFSQTARDLIDEVLATSGLGSYEELQRRRWIDLTPPAETAPFGHADGRFRFAPDWQGLPPLPDHAGLDARTDAAHPFKLIAPPARNFLNTTFSQVDRWRQKEERPYLRLTAATAAAYGISPGDAVTIGNRQGEVTLTAQIADGQADSVLVAEGLWRNGDFKGGSGINTLVSDEAAAPKGGAIFHDTSVWLKRAA
jgi:anaerobic selenocysteine-containing dehydrogenase